MAENAATSEEGELADTAGLDGEADAVESANRHDGADATTEPVGETQVSGRTQPAASVAAEVKTQPATIHDLNVLLLQGQSTPKYALVARVQQKSSTSQVAAQDARPSESARSPALAETYVPQTGTTLARTSDASSQEHSFIREGHAVGGHAMESSKQEGSGQQSTPRDSGQSSSGGARGAATQSPVVSASQSASHAPAAAVPVAARAESVAASSAPIARVDAPQALLDRLGAATSKAGPSAPPTQRAGIDSAQFSGQLQRGLAAALNQKTGAVTLRLTPETLGQLKVQVRVTDGTVAASFEVASPKVRELVKQSLDGLRQTLKDKGLDVGEVKVTVATPLPQREIGLEAIAHGPRDADMGSAAFQGQADQQTGSNAHEGGWNDRATNAAFGQPDAAEMAVDLAAISPDSAGDGLGTSQYITLPGGRLGLIALA